MNLDTRFFTFAILSLVFPSANGLSVALGASPTTCPAPAHLGFDLQRTIHRSEPGHTEGLIFDQGRLLESTGATIASSRINAIDISTGRVTKLIDTAEGAFGEGIARVGGDLIQLTYLEKRIFVYDAETLRLKSVTENSFSAQGQGWGLGIVDSDTLVASDGSDQLYFLDAKTFSTKKVLLVTMNGQNFEFLNHLQVIGGSVFANIYDNYAYYIARINLGNGCVDGLLDLSDLVGMLSKEDLFKIVITPGLFPNGVAYDPATGRMFITGKEWSSIFVIKLKP